MTHTRTLMLLIAVAPAMACNDSGGGTSSGDGSTTTGPTTNTVTTNPGTTTGTETGETFDTEDSADSGCLPEDDNCPEGTKCMPKTMPGEVVPEENACCDVVGSPKVKNDVCQQFEYYGSCLDDCDRGLLCVVDDFDGLTGVCKPFCDTANPDCDPDEICKAFFETIEDVPVVPLCMPTCDPLLGDDCEGPGWLCFPEVFSLGGGGGFMCIPPPPVIPGDVGDDCFLGNSCLPGLVCVAGSVIPGCVTELCCTPYCDLTEPDVDVNCDAAIPGTMCVPWESPMPWDDVGACAIGKPEDP